MNYGQYRKSVVAIAPASVASNATAGLDIDTRGARRVRSDCRRPHLPSDGCPAHCL
mgnify:CR=1 FL=1